MNFKESTYPIINEKIREKYKETALSDKVKSLIFECIGDIENDIQEKTKELLNNFEKTKEVNINTINECKQKYNINIGNIYDMSNSSFQIIADDIKLAIITKKAIEKLIESKNVVLKQKLNTSQLIPSDADIEINIKYKFNSESGNKLVYIYDLYINNSYELYTK